MTPCFFHLKKWEFRCFCRKILNYYLIVFLKSVSLVLYDNSSLQYWFSVSIDFRQRMLDIRLLNKSLVQVPGRDKTRRRLSFQRQWTAFDAQSSAVANSLLTLGVWLTPASRARWNADDYYHENISSANEVHLSNFHSVVARRLKSSF